MTSWQSFTGLGRKMRLCRLWRLWVSALRIKRAENRRQSVGGSYHRSRGLRGRKRSVFECFPVTCAVLGNGRVLRVRWNREVDRAIVSGVAETEIQQIKKEYISDRIRESVDVFGSQPERLGIILMSAVAVLAMLISKVLQKAREVSAKLFDTGQMQPETPEQEPVPKPAKQEMPNKPKIPPKPVMSSEAAAYPKLFKIYKELKRQNEIIFVAEKERNMWELERDDLKGFARFTKKGELQSKIDRKNEEIDILKR